MTRPLASAGRRLASPFGFPTVAVLAGMGLFVTGLHMVYAPLAYLIPGAMLVVFGGWIGLLRRPQRPTDER